MMSPAVNPPWPVRDLQTLLDHADRKEYHECIFGGAMPEGLGELGGEDETLKWEAVTIPARDKKDVEQAVEAGQTVFYQVPIPTPSRRRA